jgi:hypothetical protein
MNQDTQRHAKQGKHNAQFSDELNQTGRMRAAYRALNPRAGESSQDYFERFPNADKSADIHVSKIRRYRFHVNPFSFSARYSPEAQSKSGKNTNLGACAHNHTCFGVCSDCGQALHVEGTFTQPNYRG